MVHGNLQLAMEADHCRNEDSGLSFTASNGLTSCSKLEWQMVVAPDLGKSYPERIHFKTRTGEELFPDLCRRPKTMRQMEELMVDKNERLDHAGHTMMIIEEVIAGRLYTCCV